MSHYPENKQEDGNPHIGISKQDDLVVIEFGVMMSWIALDKIQAIDIATAIMKVAQSIDMKGH